MKLWQWKYNDMSNPKVPNRDIKWEFRIPYLLKAAGSIFGFHGGYSIHVWFLCVGFDWITDVSCGKVNKIKLWKWYIDFVIRRGWSLEFYLGIDKHRFMDWKIKRMLKKMTPSERVKHLKQLMELLE